MYLIKIKPEQIKELYWLREKRKSNGDRKSSIAGIVREAIDDYLIKIKK